MDLRKIGCREFRGPRSDIRRRLSAHPVHHIVCAAFIPKAHTDAVIDVNVLPRLRNGSGESWSYGNLTPLIAGTMVVIYGDGDLVRAYSIRTGTCEGNDGGNIRNTIRALNP